MNSGKYVFAQILTFVSRWEFDKCVKRYNGDYRTRELTCWNLFIQLLFGQYLISVVQPLYADEKIPDIYSENQVFALDSTTISLSIKLFTWAFGKYSRGAVKVHTLLDLRGSIPAFIHISHGKYHDSIVLDFMPLEKDAIS